MKGVWVCCQAVSLKLAKLNREIVLLPHKRLTPALR